jgi:hypothetical protein
VLKAFAQCGGGYPMPSGGKLSCLVNTPKVSLATITEQDVKGIVTAPQMGTRRDRLNGAIPRYRSPDHAWEIVAGDAVRNATYLAADGGKERTREIEFGLVKDKDQAAQLAAYEVANSRERGPISVELSYYWSQYKLGDCLTLDVPEANLNAQKCVVIGRSINPANNTVTLDFRTEDDAKHTWALGVTGTAPPPTTVGYDPGYGDFGTALAAILRSSYPKSLRVTAADDLAGHATITLDGGSAGADFVISYATTPPQDVTVPDGTLNGLTLGATYYLFADVDGAGDATPTYGATTDYGTALNSEAHPNRLYLNQSVLTPIAGGGTTTGEGDGSGSGGGTIGGDKP